MINKIRDLRGRTAGPAFVLLFVLFLMIFLSSLATTPADAAALSESDPCPVLYQGSSGSCVRQLQTQLDDDHVSPQVSVDGNFGAQTLQAVENFQNEMGLTADGAVGPQTVNALEEFSDEAGVPVPGTSKDSRALHSVRTFVGDTWKRTSVPLVAVGVIIFLTFAAAALFGVRSVRITYGRRKLECNIDRFTPQRIVNTQASVLHKYIDAQSAHPDRLPPAGDHIRDIGGGDW